MFLGPVFWMEARTRARRRRFFVARVLVAAGLSAVLAVVYWNFDQQRAVNQYARVNTPTGVQMVNVSTRDRNSIAELARLGGEMFQTYAITQFGLLLLLAPVYCAGSIAGDRERRALDLVFLTRLSNVQIVAAKYLVRLLELFLLAVVALPALFLCLLLGGVSWASVLTSSAVTLVFIAFIASVSLLVSIVAARVMSSVVLSYMTLLIFWVGLPIIVIMRNPGAPPAAGLSWLVIALNPIAGIGSAIMPDFDRTPWTDAYLWCLAFYGSGSILLLVNSIFVVRRLGLWASRERVARDRKTKLRRRDAARRVWDNPVAWREVKTIAVHRRMRWARIFALVMLVLFSAPVWVVYLADLLERGRPLPSDIHATTFVVVGTSILTWLLMTLQGSMSFAYERDRSTLDALLTTPLSGAQIVLGKLAGIARSSAFALAFPLFFTGLAAWHGVISGRAAALGVVILVTTALLAAAWGLFCSIATATSLRAASYAFGIALALVAGVPLVVNTALSQPTQFWLLPATFTSPTVNLDYAVFEAADHTSPYDRYAGYGSIWNQYPKWPERLDTAITHVAADAMIAAILVLLSIRRIERQHRTSPIRRRSRPIATVVTTTAAPAPPTPRSPTPAAPRPVA
ncbi:MAG: ABC transporter permease subunit [Planctomycetia bacterium]|nr:ABC transporter permease subunit [Planctomycetia bacterium]